MSQIPRGQWPGADLPAPASAKEPPGAGEKGQQQGRGGQPPCDNRRGGTGLPRLGPAKGTL